MNSRRQFLGGAAGGLTFLAGCSMLGDGSGGGSVYPSGIPASAAIPEYSMTHAGRYDVATIRDHADLVHPDCGDRGAGCTRLQNDLAAGPGFVLSLDEVEAVVTGGTHRINAYPRSLASRVGSYLFKIYDYGVDASTVESRLTERFTAGPTEGDFQYYTDSGEASGPIVAADDGERLVVGLENVVHIVAERIEGHHESFASAAPDRATVRDHLGTTDAEFVGQPLPPDDGDPAWYGDRTALGEGVEFGDSSVTYRNAVVFASEEALGGVGDDQVRSWAENAFQPAAANGLGSVSDFAIERTGRTLVVSGTADQYVGLI